MVRKKKPNEENDNFSKEKEKKRFGSIHGDAKRSICAVFLFGLAVLLVLSFFEESGNLGKFMNGKISLLFGWGKWFSPPVLVSVGIILLFRKETIFYVTKIIGLAMTFAGILGFFHLFFEKEAILKVAEKGEGGGYLGYAIAYFLMNYANVTAGSVILGVIFVIGMILAFNFSIIGLVKKLLGIGKKEESLEEDEEEKDKNSESGEVLNDQEGNEEKKESRIEFLKKKLPLFGKDKEKSQEFIPMFKENSDWEFPPIDLLESSSGKAQGGDVEANSEIILDTLKNFGIEGELGEIKTGPTITQYSFRPAIGIKVSKITGLSNDLALALALHPIRIEAPIPGKSLIGIEVPNKSVEKVRLKDMLKDGTFKKRKSNLALCLGKDVSGSHIVVDLKKMPHLMIAGATGSGKSVCINSILISLLYQNSPEDIKLILVDPKRVELSLYNGIPHLLSDVIVDNNKVINAFRWGIGEMERRYKLLQETGSRDLESYLQKLKLGQKRKTVDQETGETQEKDMERLPYVVIVIDELADLMVSYGKEVEGAVIRLAQMSRAVGIHLIVSTQRPSVEVLTGLIKANITTRIAFKVATQIDSRTILDVGGAEKLLGDGDMLYASANFSGLKRLQGVFISESEVNKVVRFIKKQRLEKGDDKIGEDIVFGEGSQRNLMNEKINFSLQVPDLIQDDSLYEDVKKMVIESGKASTSYLQRRFGLGYARAARLMDMLEEKGIVGPSDGAKARTVYFSQKDAQYEDPTDDQMKRDKWQM